MNGTEIRDFLKNSWPVPKVLGKSDPNLVNNKRSTVDPLHRWEPMDFCILEKIIGNIPEYCTLVKFSIFYICSIFSHPSHSKQHNTTLYSTYCKIEH